MPFIGCNGCIYSMSTATGTEMRNDVMLGAHINDSILQCSRNRVNEKVFKFLFPHHDQCHCC